MLDWATSTPFGRPLDPEVYMTYAAGSSSAVSSSGPGPGRVAGAAAIRSAEASRASTRRPGALTSGARADVVSTRSAPASPMM